MKIAQRDEMKEQQRLLKEGGAAAAPEEEAYDDPDGNANGVRGEEDDAAARMDVD